MADASHNDPVEIALRALAYLMQDEKALRNHAIESLAWLTLKDVQRITGFGKTKVLTLVQEGTIPMFRAPGSDEWRITRKAWEKCEARLVAAGMTRAAREDTSKRHSPGARPTPRYRPPAADSDNPLRRRKT